MSVEVRDTLNFASHLSASSTSKYCRRQLPWCLMASSLLPLLLLDGGMYQTVCCSDSCALSQGLCLKFQSVKLLRKSAWQFTKYEKRCQAHSSKSWTADWPFNPSLHPFPCSPLRHLHLKSISGVWCWFLCCCWLLFFLTYVRVARCAKNALCWLVLVAWSSVFVFTVPLPPCFFFVVLLKSCHPATPPFDAT